jgi:hypothetical protein
VFEGDTVNGRRHDNAKNYTLLGPLVEVFSSSGPSFSRKQCRCIPRFITPTQEGSDIKFIKFVLWKKMRCGPKTSAAKT